MRAQQHAKLSSRLFEQRFALDERFGESISRCGEDARELLEKAIRGLTTLPATFHPNPKIKRLIETRKITAD